MKKLLHFLVFTSVLLFATQSFGTDYIVIFGSKECGPCQSLKGTVFEKTTYSKLTSKYRVVYKDVDTIEGQVVWQKYREVGKVKSGGVPQIYIIKENKKRKSYHIEKSHVGNLLRIDLFDFLKLNLHIGK